MRRSSPSSSRCTLFACVLGGLWMVGVVPETSHAIIRQSFGVYAGGTQPLAPNSFKSLYDTGYGFSGAIRFRLNLRFHGSLEVGYYRHISDNDAFGTLIENEHPNVTVSGYDLWVVPVTLVGEFDLLKRGSTKPYLLLGAGYYSLGVTTPAISGLGADQLELPDPSESAFGVQAGLGVRTPIALGVTLSVDVNVHLMFTADESTQFLPVRVGLQF